MDLSMAFCLLLSFVSIQSQQPINVYVSVNGNTISDDPILIYHDEIEFGPSPPTVDTIDSQGAVVCRSENHVTANWRSPSGRFLLTEGDVYKQVESENVSMVIPSFSQLSTPNDDRPPIDGRVVIPNGLWLCQVDNDDIPDQDIIESFKFVGIYNRGYGAIDTVTVSIVNSSDFMGDPPTFTLIADISGGPPVTYTWGRNSNDFIAKSRGPYDLSLEVNGVNTLDVESVSLVLQESRYRSTLTVTGNLPGWYGFHVINRAMMNYKRDSIYIRGGILRDLTAEQNNLTTVLITWTKPFVPWSLDPDDDSLELEIVIHLPDGNNITYYDEESPIIFNITMLGVHTVQEMYLSQQLPTPEIMFTVKSHGPATINVSLRTSILANLTFFPSEFNLPVVQYVVKVSRVTGSSPWQELCPEIVDNKPPVTTTAASMTFTGLEEFSTYTVSLTTTFDVFGSNVDEVTPQMIFTTLSAAPTGVPRDVVVVSRTSRSFMVTWDIIECIERNGIILRYRVNSNATIGSTSGRNFLAEGLSPYKQYSFQVAGVTDDSTGPFTDMITITTDEEVPGPVSYLTGLAKFTSVDLTWSAPQEPNGVIISYEVTYTVAGITHIINTGLSTTFIIPSLPPRTTVSGLSVSAYTKVGRGEAATIVDQKTLGNSIVKNVEVDTLSATAVRVSWDRVVLPEITGYIVYVTGDRRRNSITVTSSVTSVDIEGLLDTLKYQFRVAVIAEINGKEFIGDIPLDLNLFEAISTTCTRNCRIVVGVIFSYFVIMILVTTLLFYCVRMYRVKIISKSRSERVRLLSIQQHTSEFKIDANETLEQNPDINLPQTTNFKINADDNQQQKANFKIDANETLECGENPDVNQQQITDFKIDADEKKLECGQNSDVNQQQTISPGLVADNRSQPLKLVNLTVIVLRKRNDADKTLEHDQNPDTNQQQTTHFKIETLECVQNSDINQQQTISSGNNSDETLEHDQNTDTNQQQKTDSKIDADEKTLESDQNSEKQTILSGSYIDETLEHDQDSDNHQLHNFKIDTDETKSSEDDHDQDI